MGRVSYVLYQFSILLICLGSHNLFAQELSDNDRYDFLDAEYYYDILDYERAIRLYQKVADKYPENANFNYTTGRCLLQMPEKDDLALPYLEKAVKTIDEKYVPGSSKNEGAPPEAWLYYGDALHRANRLEDASYAYHQFKSYVTKNESATKMINQRIRGLGISYEASLRPPHINVTNLGQTINTDNSEYNPVFSADGETMIYTAFEDPRDRIYMSIKINDTWSDPKDISTQLGSKGEYYTTALSADGQELYCVNYDPRNSDIFVSTYNKGKWSRLEPLDKRINSSYHESGACLTSDGQKLYICSDRNGGYGGFDIYVSTRESDGWSKAENLGAVINTAGDEVSPRLNSTDDVLYFSSDGFESIGKLDIQFSAQDENGNWQPPKNIGAPYNTPDDDVGFAIYGDGKKVYISQVSVDGYGKKDLYVFHNSGEPEQPEFEEEPLYAQQVVEEQQPQKEEAIEEPVKESIVEEFSENIEESNVEEEIPTENISENISYPEPVETNRIKETEPVKESKSEPEPEPNPVKTVETGKAEKPKTTYTGPNTYNNAPSDKDYTIQIMALIFPKESPKFENLNKNLIKITLGEDGYTRYTFSEYSDLATARSDLKELVNKGFKDAFIRRTQSISNY